MCKFRSKLIMVYHSCDPVVEHPSFEIFVNPVFTSLCALEDNHLKINQNLPTGCRTERAHDCMLFILRDD